MPESIAESARSAICFPPMTETSTIPEVRRSRFARIILVLVALFVALASAGVLYENICEARDRRFNPMPGQRVNIGSDQQASFMHIYCTGQGTPAVILESGLGDSYLSWSKVQPQIATMTRVCSYDRGGIGYSDPRPRPRSSEVFAEELHSLLDRARVPDPYILVGHSLGGFDVRIFTASHRNQVAGLLLVDSSHPDQETRLPAELKNMEGSWRSEALFLEFTMPFGIPRLLGLCDEPAIERAADCNFHSARETYAEMDAIPASAAQAAASGSLGDLPLIVLAHDPDKPSSELPPDLAKPTNEAWQKMQEELAHLSSRGTLIVAKNSGHYIQTDRPDVVVDAIRKLVDQSRSGHVSPQ
jgi:pimeloyl-ACP methyl ester carboxylesterase